MVENVRGEPPSGTFVNVTSPTRIKFSTNSSTTQKTHVWFTPVVGLLFFMHRTSVHHGERLLLDKLLLASTSIIIIIIIIL